MPNRAPADQPVTDVRGLRLAFAWIALLHTALLFAQPILAGMSLEGDAGALDLHFSSGMAIIGIAVVQVVVALLWWRAGRGPVAALALSALVVGLEVAQFVLGDFGKLSLHLPLGIVTLVGAAYISWLGFRDPAVHAARLAEEAAEIAAAEQAIADRAAAEHAGPAAGPAR